MLPAAIEYLLTLTDDTGRNSLVNLQQYQVIIPNVPPLTSVNYSVSPPTPVSAYILYEYTFGEAMVPHAFNVRISHGASSIFNAIVSGIFTTSRGNVFVVLGQQQAALLVTLQNLTLLVQYYELTTHYLSISNDEYYAKVKDALRRMYTSARTEDLAQQSRDLLNAIAKKPPMPGPPIGGR